MRLTVAIALVALFATAACGKADLTQDCTMNGFGQGRCNFTNKGDGKGSICGHIKVLNKNGGGTAESSVFCSGEIEKQSTKEVSFSVPDVRDICKSEGLGHSWGEVCDFTFEAEKKE